MPMGSSGAVSATTPSPWSHERSPVPAGRVRGFGVNIRCAIYTRKSSDEGLEQEFNSLDAQREACEAYIVSQRHAGWIALADMYDDGGLSGGTTERPALQRLLSDIKAGKVQIIVVYKVDRLTRSLSNFAKIVDVLDAYNASFVSVTQQFNTTTSMGRLTLNMLLSFAQFEREIAGERIRDKIAASKKKGMWMGGNVPLGYDVKDRKLIVNEPEASTLRLIFRRYAELGSVALLKAALDRQDIVSKRREGAGGRLAGGQHFSRGALYLMLQNRIYRGDIVHQGEAYSGQHQAILDPELWQIVQDKLAANRQERSLAVGAEAPSLLAGLIVDADGNPMTPIHATKRAKRYRYYVSASLLTGDHSRAQKGMRIPAGDVEALVLDRLKAFFSSRTDIGDALTPLGLEARAFDAALRNAFTLSKRWLAMPPIERKSLVLDIVEQISVAADRIEIRLSRVNVAAALQVGERGQRPDLDPVVLSIEAKVRRAGKGKRLVIENGAEAEVNAGLVEMIKEAFAIRNQLLSGSHDSIEAMSGRLAMNKGRLTSLVRLSYLGPEIVRALLAGSQSNALTPSRLLRLSKNLPHDWKEQRCFLGFAA
jgi:site-specific DNA recombinase